MLFVDRGISYASRSISLMFTTAQVAQDVYVSRKSLQIRCPQDNYDTTQ